VQRRNQLAPFALKNDELVQQRDKTSAELASTKALNRAIAEAVSGVRSGSALLTELQRLAPEAIRFQLVSSKGNTLELEGDVHEPFALQTLNAFQLRLDASSFFEPDGFALERAARGSNEGTLNFRFNGNFSSDAIRATRPRLAELETPGLLERMNRLEREGLLP